MSQNLWKIEKETLYLLGNWTLDVLGENPPDIEKIPGFSKVNASQVLLMDTFGALFLIKILETRDLDLSAVVEMREEVRILVELVYSRERKCPPAKRMGIVHSFSVFLEKKLMEYLFFFDFVGRFFVESIRKFRDFELNSMLRDMENMGIRALIIIGVLSFLIGVVIAYQSAAQLARFGANIFIVDLVVLSVVRELGPLIVAILMSGRSASSYTATIGLMKVTEEIDVLEVMGVSPYATLVLPRVICLILITPLLVVFSDIIGVFGGMLVAKVSLNVDFAEFVRRMESVLTPAHFFAGLAKAPVFGFFIALVGTWKGFMVEKRAESIGFRVIESVVASLFGVLVIDALFSVVYRWLGI